MLEFGTDGIMLVMLGAALVLLIAVLLTVRKGGRAQAPAVSPAAAVQPPGAPYIQAGIPGEVVAAIAAAVACVEEGPYTLQSITAAQGGSAVPSSGRRGAWGQAGVLAGTEPF